MEYFGFVAALFIGVVLGLIGGGGSILTVPILVYLMGINALLATAYSLFVVGVTALVGTVRNIPKKLVDFKTAFLFAIPAFISVYLCRRYFVSSLPEILYQTQGLVLSRDMGIMLFFALIMLLAAISMIRNKRTENENLGGVNSKINYPIIIVLGVIVGFLTGMVGAGGGFLIIPALVLYAKLPMKKAIATSLLIIAINSLIGFIGDLQNVEMDWSFLLTFTSISVVGIFIGIGLNKLIDGKKLKRGFGWFVLVMAIYIFLREII